MTTDLVDCDSDALRIGQPVRLMWTPTDGGPPVPVFTPRHSPLYPLRRKQGEEPCPSTAAISTGCATASPDGWLPSPDRWRVQPRASRASDCGASIAVSRPASPTSAHSLPRCSLIPSGLPPARPRVAASGAEEDSVR
jgi:hypothetical protein